MRGILVVIIVVIVVVIGTISCIPQAPPTAPPVETPPPTVDEPYYDSDEVIALIKKQLPDVVQHYTTTGELKLGATDLRKAGKWEAMYLGKGKWQVTCVVYFVNWFDYEKPMNATGTFSWNFYEKSKTIESIGFGYREITNDEFKP